MKEKLMGLLKDEEGQGMVEYALILGAVAIMVVAAFAILGPELNTVFSNIF